MNARRKSEITAAIIIIFHALFCVYEIRCEVSEQAASSESAPYCPSGTFQSSDNGGNDLICKACDPACSTCIGPSATSCTSCRVNNENYRSFNKLLNDDNTVNNETKIVNCNFNQSVGHGASLNRVEFIVLIVVASSISLLMLAGIAFMDRYEDNKRKNSRRTAKLAATSPTTASMTTSFTTETVALDDTGDRERLLL